MGVHQPFEVRASPAAKMRESSGALPLSAQSAPAAKADTAMTAKPA
jgi:hypothetical protein